MTSAKSARKKNIQKMEMLQHRGAEGMDADKFHGDMTVFFEMIEVGEEHIDLY